MGFTVYLIRQNAYSRIKIIIFLLESCYICFMNRDSCKGIFQEYGKAVTIVVLRGFAVVSWERLAAFGCQQPVGKPWSERPLCHPKWMSGLIHVLATYNYKMCTYKQNLNPGFSDGCELLLLRLGPVASSCVLSVVHGHACRAPPWAKTPSALLAWRHPALPPASGGHTGSDSFLHGIQHQLWPWGWSLTKEFWVSAGPFPILESHLWMIHTINSWT